MCSIIITEEGWVNVILREPINYPSVEKILCSWFQEFRNCSVFSFLSVSSSLSFYMKFNGRGKDFFAKREGKVARTRKSEKTGNMKARENEKEGKKEGGKAPVQVRLGHDSRDPPSLLSWILHLLLLTCSGREREEKREVDFLERSIQSSFKFPGVQDTFFSFLKRRLSESE